MQLTPKGHEAWQKVLSISYRKGTIINDPIPDGEGGKVPVNIQNEPIPISMECSLPHKAWKSRAIGLVLCRYRHNAVGFLIHFKVFPHQRLHDGMAVMPGDRRSRFHPLNK